MIHHHTTSMIPTLDSAAPQRRPLPSVLLAAAALAVLAACSPAVQSGPEAATARSPQASDAAAEPAGLFLTWQRDPTTTMTVDWHTGDAAPGAVLQFRRQGERRWQSRAPQSFPFPHSERTIHRVELTGLRPDATYEFRTGEASRSYTFRTMPARADRPVRFIAGGDVRHNQEMMERTGRQAAVYDPDFIVWGGDLAYADGLPQNVGRWYEFFDAIRNTLVTPEGRAIPILLALGNHEVAGSYHFRIDGYRQDVETRRRISPFFYDLFATPGQPGYGVIDFGDYMSVVLLDTDHNNPIAGAQTAWLERTLRERQRVPHVFPVYHVPGYPSVRAFDGEVSQRVREHWVPLFDRYGVRVAFENHDHIYKRTWPLRGGERHADGVVYLGDGAWGVGVREIGRDQGGNMAPYLERAESVRHFILGEIRGAERRFIMVDEEGTVFDEFPAGARAAIGAPRFALPAPPAAAAR
jgi:acid phosphatase type 7